VHLIPPPLPDATVDDLVGAGDGAAGRRVADGGEKRNLGFQMLGVLGFRVRELTRFVRWSWGRFKVPLI
jgi:hypothetical protein